MEYYSPAKGAPSSFAGLGSSASDPTAGTVLNSHPLYEDWRLKHGAPSPGSTSGDAGPEEAVWPMTMQGQEGMDGTQGPYPERPGEPDCVYYMRTGLCGFGMTCRFNHPPNRKLAAAVARGKGEYPERMGQPECQYYLKTGTCKFGATCKYHHPRDKAGSTGRVHLNVLGLPLRQGEKECAYYMRTGSCKYGVTCKFHHPQPAALGALVPMSPYGNTGAPSSPAPQPYPPGLPSWAMTRSPYLTPRIQGPSSFAPVILPSPQGIMSMPGWNTYPGGLRRSTTFLHTFKGPPTDGGQQHGYVYGTAPQGGEHVSGYPPYMQGSSAMGLPAIQSQSMNGQKDPIFPERPGQPECQYYMKTGDCKFGITCRYHHPKDRATPSPTCVLSPIGLPLRPGAPPCTFYTRYGICKFGPTCKFDHPLGGLTYSPSASSLADVPVAPYPIGSSPTTLAPSSSSDASREAQMPPLEATPYPDDHPRGHIHSSRDNSDSAVVSSSTGANISQNLSTQAGSSEKASSSGQASDSLNGKN